jgi:hypothetical protein
MNYIQSLLKGQLWPENIVLVGFLAILAIVAALAILGS